MVQLEEGFRPDYIGIGAARSGTSWLANCLRSHPDIGLSEPKEILYFNSLGWPRSGSDGLEVREANPNYSKSISWYARHFSHCREKKVIGEFSPIYLYDEAASSRIIGRFPNVRLIVTLRNPIDRAFSHYGMILGKAGRGIEVFDEAVKRYPVLIEMGLYARQLKRYLDRFDRHRILVLLFDDLVENPMDSLKTMFEFLGVDATINAGMLESDTNPSGKQRAPAVRKLLHRTSRMLIDLKLGPVLHGLRKAGAYRIFNRVNRKSLNLGEMRPETRRYLSAIFKQDIEELQSIIGRDLNCWK